MKSKSIFLISIFLLMILSLTNSIFANDIEHKIEKIESYSNTINTIYWIMIGIVFMVGFVTLMMIYQHYGSRHLFQIILFIIGILMIVLTLLFFI